MHHSFILLFVLEWNAANQALATLAFFGVGVNLVLFLTRVLRQDSAEAANNVSKWTGTVYIFSLIGAFLSDSYWGRYLTCAIFQFILVLVHPPDPIISKKKKKQHIKCVGLKYKQIINDFTLFNELFSTEYPSLNAHFNFNSSFY